MKIQRVTRSLTGIALLTAIAFGASRCTTTRYSEPYGEGGHITIIVAANDAVVPDPVRLSKGKKHEADWYSWPGSTLQIKFDDSTIFPKLNCEKNHCSSGAIKESPAYKDYGYHAAITFAGGKASADPIIWIQP